MPQRYAATSRRQATFNHQVQFKNNQNRQFTDLFLANNLDRFHNIPGIVSI